MDQNAKPSVAILGAGSWGTAMAVHIAQAGFHVALWARDAKQAKNMQASRTNARYLPDIKFPDILYVTSDLAGCQRYAELILIAVPSHAFTSILPHIQQKTQGIAWLTKGIDPATNQLLSQCVKATLGPKIAMHIISGPSFAKDMAQGLPTAICLASNSSIQQQSILQYLHHGTLRVYTSTDLIGVQVAACVKNIIAIACGISDGLHFGANARAAIITRGLHEIKKLAIALGAKESTVYGLAGLGDLVLTCTDDQSRNRRFGLLLGQGMSPEKAKKNIQQVVEGADNVQHIIHMAQQHHIEMPICEQIEKILSGTISPVQALNYFMQRAPKQED